MVTSQKKLCAALVSGNHWSHTLGQDQKIFWSYSGTYVEVTEVMKKFMLSSSWSSDVKKGKVNEEKREDLTRKVINEKDVKNTNVATSRAYRAYMQVQSDMH